MTRLFLNARLDHVRRRLTSPHLAPWRLNIERNEHAASHNISQSRREPDSPVEMFDLHPQAATLARPSKSDGHFSRLAASPLGMTASDSIQSDHALEAIGRDHTIDQPYRFFAHLIWRQTTVRAIPTVNPGDHAGNCKSSETNVIDFKFALFYAFIQ